MTLTDTHIKIIKAEICPYCGSHTRRTQQEEIYGKSFSGNDVIVCDDYPKCDSYVGCHSTGEPLGRLADKNLREAKKSAHHYFDQLWQKYGLKRGMAYKYLADELNLPKEYTHIGMFSIKTCNKVRDWAKERISEIESP